MVDPTIRLEELIRRLRNRGYRLTPQRMAIVKVLVASDGHPSAEQIHAQISVDFPMTTLGTVYKTISLLKQMGEVLELGFPNDCNRYDGNKPYPHPHLICVNCKKIIDANVPAWHILTQELAERTGYEGISHRLDFYGVCPDC